MIDYDSIWRTQDEIRTVVNAVLGECIWNLSYSERRMAIELELTVTLDDDAIGNLCCQFPISADYDGLGARGTKIVFPQTKVKYVIFSSYSTHSKALNPLFYRLTYKLLIINI